MKQLRQLLERKLYDLGFVFPCNFQNWNDFPSLSTTMIAQLKWKIISLVWIFPEQFITRTVIFLKNRPAKTLLPCLFTSKIRKLQRPLPTALSKFTQENWFWNWIWKTMGEFDLDFKCATNHFPHQNSSTVAVVTTENPSLRPPAINFQKLHKRLQCLI